MRGVPRSLAPARAAGLVAVGAGLVLGAAHVPAPVDLAPGAGQERAMRAVADPVTVTTLVCPGPESLGVEGLKDSSAQTVSILASGAPAAALPPGMAAGQGEGSLSVSGLPPGGGFAVPATVRGQALAAQLSTARSALISGSGVLAPGTVATQWSWTRTGNKRGLVTSACLPAAASSWLIAGGAEPGRLEHLVLANPGANPVTVDVRVLGSGGPIPSPNGQGVIVAGRGRTVILLDAIAGSDPSPVLHVTARGGTVAAVLSDSWLDGVVPRGGDNGVPVSSPAREQVVAGVPTDGRPIVRVAVPGGSEAVVQARVLTSGGSRPLPAGSVTRIAAGSARDIDLGSLPPGAYALQVRADVPVVAAALVDRRRSARGPSDLAWSVASLPIRGLGGMVLPASSVRGVAHRLDLAATGGPASVRVTTVEAAGRVTTRTAAIGADSVSTMLLKEATAKGPLSVWVTPVAGTVRAAVLTTVADAGGPMVSVTPLTEVTLTATSLPLRELGD